MTKTDIVTISGNEVEVTVKANITNAPETPCQSERNNYYIPTSIRVEYTREDTVVRVFGSRVPNNGPIHDSDAYHAVYYLNDRQLKPPIWAMSWLEEVERTAAKVGATR